MAPCLLGTPLILGTKENSEKKATKCNKHILLDSRKGDKDAPAVVEKMEVDEKKEEKKEEKKVEEPTFEILQNPCRVVRPQLNVISMEEPKKFKAIKDSSIGGIIMVKRVDGETGGDIVEPVTIKKTLVESEDEPEPPEPFEYTE